MHLRGTTARWAKKVPTSLKVVEGRKNVFCIPILGDLTLGTLAICGFEFQFRGSLLSYMDIGTSIRLRFKP